MTYPIDPNQALLTWCLRHGLWAQRLDASTPGPFTSNGTVRSPSQGSFPVACVVGEESTPMAYRAQAGDDSPRVLVVCESERGRTGSAADAIAAAAARNGADALASTIDDTPPARVAQADAVILGCWAPGKVPFGDEPARRLADWIETLPNLDGKPVGVFCVYRFFPHTFADMATRVAETELRLVDRLVRKVVHGWQRSVRSTSSRSTPTQLSWPKAFWSASEQPDRPRGPASPIRRDSVIDAHRRVQAPYSQGAYRHARRNSNPQPPDP